LGVVSKAGKKFGKKTSAHPTVSGTQPTLGEEIFPHIMTPKMSQPRTLD